MEWIKAASNAQLRNALSYISGYAPGALDAAMASEVRQNQYAKWLDRHSSPLVMFPTVPGAIEADLAEALEIDAARTQLHC